MLCHVFQEPDPDLEQHFATVTGLLGKMSNASSISHVGTAADVLLNYLTAQCSRKIKRRFTRISTNQNDPHWLDILHGVGLSDFRNIDFCAKINASGYIDVDKAWLDLAYLTPREKAWFLDETDWEGLIADYDEKDPAAVVPFLVPLNDADNYLRQFIQRSRNEDGDVDRFPGHLSMDERQDVLQHAYYHFHVYATTFIALFGHHLGQVVKILFAQHKRWRALRPPKEANREKFYFHCTALLRISDRVCELAWRSPFWKRLLIYSDAGVRATKERLLSKKPAADSEVETASQATLVVAKTRGRTSPPQATHEGLRTISGDSTSSVSSTASSSDSRASEESELDSHVHNLWDDEPLSASDDEDHNTVTAEMPDGYDDEKEHEEEEEADPTGNPAMARNAAEARELQTPSGSHPQENLESSRGLRNLPFSDGEEAQNIVFWLRHVTFHIETVSKWESAAMEGFVRHRAPVVPLQLKVITTPTVNRQLFAPDRQAWRTYVEQLMGSGNHAAAAVDRYLTAVGRAKVEGPFVGQEHCEATLCGLLWHAQNAGGHPPRAAADFAAAPALSHILADLRRVHPSLVGTSKRCCHICSTILALLADPLSSTPHPPLRLHILDTHDSIYPYLLPACIPVHIRTACLAHYRAELTSHLRNLARWDARVQRAKARAKVQLQLKQEVEREQRLAVQARVKDLDSEPPSSSSAGARLGNTKKSGKADSDYVATAEDAAVAAALAAMKGRKRGVGLRVD